MSVQEEKRLKKKEELGCSAATFAGLSQQHLVSFFSMDSEGIRKIALYSKKRDLVLEHLGNFYDKTSHWKYKENLSPKVSFFSRRSRSRYQSDLAAFHRL